MNGLLIRLVVMALGFFVSSSLASESNLTLALQKKAEADQLKKDKDFSNAGEGYFDAVQLGLSFEFGLWSAVDSYIKANENDRVIQILQTLAENGSVEVDYFNSVAGLFKDQHHTQYTEILALVERNIEISEQKSSTANEVQSAIFLQDVDRFFEAFDQANNTESQLEKVKLYEDLYFNRASIGMVDYMSMKVPGVDAFVTHVEKNRAYYEDVRSATKEIEALIPAAQVAMGKMKQYYPQAATPDIYFVVGMHTSAGTASVNGILLGADFIADGEENIENLDEWTYPFITAAADKVWVVVHEYVHTLQNTNSDNVLGNALVEGGADFLANLLYAPPDQPKEYTRFGFANECLVKSTFIEQMESDDISMWTGNNGQDLPENWVPDLGYFVGQQIAEAYYAQAEDKGQAIKDLLELKDPEWILAESGYLTLDGAVAASCGSSLEN